MSRKMTQYSAEFKTKIVFGNFMLQFLAKDSNSVLPNTPLH